MPPGSSAPPVAWQTSRVKLRPEALEFSGLRMDDIERVILNILNDQETLNLYTAN